MAASFVNVSIESVHTDAAENQDVIKCLAIGKKNLHNGKVYIGYEEPDETGMPGTKSIIKLDGDVVTLTRSGQVQCKMVFQAGTLTHCAYQTPFGVLRMSVETRFLEIDTYGDIIEVDIEYLLMINDEVQGMTRLRVRIGEDGSIGH